MAQAAPVGVENNPLRPCPSSPNCVCSFDAPNRSSYIEPLIVEENPIKGLGRILRELGLTVHTMTENYLHATETSRIFRFVDDLEARYLPENQTLHFRSASRVGYYDLGVNRRRVQRIKRRLLESKASD